MPAVDAKLMTQADYARHRGCSREAVRKAVESGRITAFGPDKQIDQVLADAQWARNTRARVGSGPAAVADPAAAAAAAGQPPAPRTSYEEARRRRETAEAELAELKLAEQQGDLIRAGVVRTTVAKLAAGLREGLMQIPSRLAPVLAAETSAAAVHDQLVAELRQVLEQVTSVESLQLRPED